VRICFSLEIGDGFGSISVDSRTRTGKSWKIISGPAAKAIGLCAERKEAVDVEQGRVGVMDTIHKVVASFELM
jgi:hypothetical protein